ncbi:hypothetical protein FEM03_19500 [Phragmitibacter flavus]|uniref:DUF4175 family protein n=1 Tax=Phragmitibacter flavus TaxID=2576071 RepID=A0A5R8K9U0_9BACT|nr:DUF4175 family protein [Phragmitibacter flavus]TLD69056.1 hypothetical protein FEM03_19500 [Phragmitibacter flavus]
MSLRPVTLQALAAFQKRRTRLLLIRAALFSLAILLGLFLLIALLDRATFMPDGLRKTLSYTSWIAALAFTLWQTLALLRQHRDTTATARLMESADPTLHEKLLSAVELSDETKAHHDSPEFREHLQDQVAAQLSNFDPVKALPNRLLQQTIRAVTVVIVLIIALSFFGQLHLPGFLARAALPFANIGRPSSVKIHFLIPEKSPTLVPFSSQTQLSVRIDGPTPKRVIIEQQNADTKPTRLEMTSVGNQQYESTLQVEQTDLRYRVLAADAITSWQTLEARARPRAIEFIKTITPPAYTKLPAQTLTEDHGDLSALEGSTIRVQFEANQPLESATAVLHPAQTPLSITSTENNNNTRQLELTLDGKSEAWALDLTASKTLFTNEETSPFRIDTITDLPPSLTLTTPATDQSIRPDQPIAISGTASDDIGLAKVEFSYAINGTDWQNQDIPGASGLEATVQSTLALANLPLNPGDALLIKLAATDLKGQRSESAAARLLIVTDQPDQQQRAWAATQKQLAQQAKALNQEMRTARKQAEQIRDDAKSDNPETAAALANLKQNLATVEEQADQLWEQLKKAAQQAPDTLKQQEINLVGQHLAELRNEHLPALKEQTQKPEGEVRKQIRKSANEAGANAETLNEALRTFATADLAQTAKEAYEILAPQQQKLADKAIDANRDPAQRTRWQEQQRAALAAAKSAQQDLQSLHDIAPDNRQRDIQNQLKNLDQKIPGIESALDTPDQKQAPEYLYGQAHELRNANNNARDFSRWMAEEAQNKAAELRDRLNQRDNPALAALGKARDQLNQAANEKKPDQQADAKKAAEQKLQAAADQLKAQSELREQNASTNTLAALDQNRLSRAIDKLAEEIPDQPTKESAQPLQQKLNDLVETARTLEADALAQDAQSALEEGQQRIQDKATPQQQLNAALAAQSQLRPLDKALQRAKADQPAIQAAQQARGQADRQQGEARNQANQATQQKQNQQDFQQPADQHNPTLDANQQAQQQLAAARQAFIPKVESARGTLEELTPKLSELAENAAKNLNESQQQTSELAQNAANQSTEQTAEQTQALMPQADANAEQLADLQAALRQETAHADMADLAQRQMARTADVGLAQMQQQTPKIANNLQQATESTQTAQQQQSLQNAAQAQQQTADALNQLSKNLANMEQGKTLPEDALAAQQAMEEALGIKQPLDESYQNIDELNQLMQEARDNPQKTLAALEQELQKNTQMQQALGQLAKQAATETQSALTELKNQPQNLPTAAPAEAHDLARVARHQQRLNQPEAAQQIQAASEQLQQLAKSEANAGNAEAAAQSAQAAQQAAAKATQSLPTTPSPSLFQAAKGAMLAQALDQLDQAVNPMGQGDAEQQQQGQQQQQQSAQQSLANAAQSQAQSMAQDRAQGQVPGQQPSPGQGQTAQQNSPSPPAGQQGQPSPDAGGNLSMTAPNTLVPVLTLQGNESWGRLPARMAKDLTEATRQEPSPEYRAAIESYYKAIAEKSK